MIRNAKSKYFKGLNPKTFWKITKYLTKKSSSIPVLTDQDGNIIQDDAEKATLLNNSQCFNRTLPPLANLDITNLDLPTAVECPEYLLRSKVLQMLLALDTTKSNGADGISATMLKTTATSITPVIAKTV